MSNNRKTGLFLQVRLNSTRMPGKALMELQGKPLIVHVMERLNAIPAETRALLTTKCSEPYLRPLAEQMGWAIFTGDKQNVLKRFVEAALHFDVNTVIRATGDNPLTSSEVANETLGLFFQKQADLAYLAPVPYGSGVEVVKVEALLKALKNTRVPYHMEHVTPYIYANPDKFKIVTGRFHDDEASREDVRVTIDTRADYEKVNYFFEKLSRKRVNLTINSVVKLWDELDTEKFRKVLFITAAGDNFGFGHLKRALLLASRLEESFEVYFSFLNESPTAVAMIRERAYNYIDYKGLMEPLEGRERFDRVVVDLRDTDEGQMGEYMKLGSVISIDDMGPGGQLCNLNVKTLPSLKSAENAKYMFNYEGLGYLFLDKYSVTETAGGERGEEVKNVLITLGGADPAGLTNSVASAVKEAGYKVTVIRGPFFKESTIEDEGIEVVKSPDSLAKYIDDAHIVITTFGMTMMESLALKKRVLVLNPSDYHDALTRELGYPYLLEGAYRPALRGELKALVTGQLEKLKGAADLDKFHNLGIGEGFEEIVDSIKKSSPSPKLCPYCSCSRIKLLARTNSWNMYSCRKCSLFFIDKFYEEGDIYNSDYFLEEYKNQYGKTYEEDRENIRGLAKERYRMISSYLKGGKLLDVGSGLGFFAEYCQEQGFKTLSLDISEYAVNYIKETLKLDALCADYSYLEKNDFLYDVITSFYFIEHVKDFEKLIFLFKNHLKRGGVLALSTPNAAGISIKKNFKDYVAKHPGDHYRIFSPAFLKRVLKRNGFKNIRFRITGIHLTRMGIPEKVRNNRAAAAALTWLAKLLKLGDTFEIYAQKM